MKLKPNRVTSDEPPDEGTGGEYYVLGGEHVGEMVARRLQADGHTVTVVDAAHDSTDIPGHKADPQDLRALEEAGVSDTSTVVVAMSCDSQNLLTAQLVSAHFDVSETVVLVNVPDRCDVFAAVGHEPICATTTLSDAVVDSLKETNRSANQTA